MSPGRGVAGWRGRGAGARPRVPAYSPRLAIPGILAAFAAVACAASPAAASGAVAGGHAAPRFRALVHVEDMDAELVLDEAGDGDWHSLGDEKTRHTEARVAYEDALADIEERLYGSSLLLTKTASDENHERESDERDVESAFRDLFSFVADAPSPKRARETLARAASRRASRLQGEDKETPKVKSATRSADLETLVMLARVADEAYASALSDARAPLVEYFGERVVDANDPVTLEPVDGGAGGVSVAFGFDFSTFRDPDPSDEREEKNQETSGVDLGAVASEKGARLLEALASINRFDAGDIRGYERVPETSPTKIGAEQNAEKNDALETAAKALSRAVEAAAAASAARNAVIDASDDASGEKDEDENVREAEASSSSSELLPPVASLEDLPADWRAVADALYLLASLVELGVSPKTLNAYPTPKIELVNRVEVDRHSKERKRGDRFFFQTDQNGRWSDVHFADADPNARIEVPTHPALLSPKKWAAAAVFAAAEMGNREARLAAGDRVLRNRGFASVLYVAEDDETDSDALPNYPYDLACERSMRVYLLPVAEKIADAAEADGDVRVPSDPPRLRERERDAGYIDDADGLDDGDAQIEMERDMANRGVPEAERHLGYRALVGRGVQRDEGDALRRFGNAANLGDPLAMFNLGYMHMRGVGTNVNHTEARRLFEKAAALDVAAAHNGVGVLDYNGWATADGAPNVFAARARFEAGAAAGDPDASFNLGTLYQTGAGGLPVDHSLAYSKYQAASDAGHWRAPLAVAKLTLEGWKPEEARAATSSSDESEGDENSPSFIDTESTVEKNCRKAARLVMAFVEERLVVFSDEHEAALAALEGGFVDADDGTEELSNNEADDEKYGMYFEEQEVGPDPWSALVRYALIAERGGEAGLANAAFLAKKAGAAKQRRGVFETNGAPLPRHVTRRAARDAAREALTRLAAMGDVEARVDLGDIEWAAAVEGDEDETHDQAFDQKPGPGPSQAEVARDPNARVPTPPLEPAPDAASGSFATPPPPVPKSASSEESSEESFRDESLWSGVFSSPLTSLSAQGILDPPRPPAPASPPRGFDRMRRVAFHYEEASLLGLPEGSVSLAWCWSRGVGVPRRDLKQAERALWKAHDDSMDEMESFAPLAAAAAVSFLRAATAFVSSFAVFCGDAVGPSVDLVKFLDLAFGAKESNAVLYPGSIPGTSPGTSPGTTSGDKTRNGRRAHRRETTRAAEAENGFFLRVERCVLATLVCGFAAIGYARFIALSGEHRDAMAAFLDSLSPATVAGVAGAVAAAAWVAVA